jgi:CrcB protein
MTARREIHSSPEPREAGLQAQKIARDASTSRRVSIVTSTRLYAAVGIGSVIGGTLRWLASELLHHWLCAGFPWGTFFANVTGSFLIGFYAALSGPDGRLFASPVQRHFMMTGICGGYTTFSIFSYETVRLLQAENFQLASLNVGLSLIGWFVAVWGGFALATRINRLRS